MWESNVYYHPENCGLEVVAEIEYSDGSYQFDMRVVWRHLETGVLYTQRDSGCSCPTPFESYNDLASLEVVNIESLMQEVASETANTTVMQRFDFIYKVRHALAGGIV